MSSVDAMGQACEPERRARARDEERCWDGAELVCRVNKERRGSAEGEYDRDDVDAQAAQADISMSSLALNRQTVSLVCSTSTRTSRRPPLPVAISYTRTATTAMATPRWVEAINKALSHPDNKGKISE